MWQEAAHKTNTIQLQYSHVNTLVIHMYSIYNIQSSPNQVLSTLVQNRQKPADRERGLFTSSSIVHIHTHAHTLKIPLFANCPHVKHTCKKKKTQTLDAILKATGDQK